MTKALMAWSASAIKVGPIEPDGPGSLAIRNTQDLIRPNQRDRQELISLSSCSPPPTTRSDCSRQSGSMAITSHVTTPRIIGLAILVPATYALFTYRKLTRATTSKSGRWRGCYRKGAPEQREGEDEAEPVETPGGLPEEIRQDDSGWVVSYERVASRPVPASALAYPLPATVEDGTGVSSVLKVYTRAAQLAFSWTPQAFAIRAATGVAEIRRTFDTEYIQSLDFHQGSVVNGAYQVSLHTTRSAPVTETLELSLVPPPDYRGPIRQRDVDVEKGNGGANAAGEPYWGMGS
jgi:hypothetical protein